MSNPQFIEEIQKGYTSKGAFFKLGAAKLNDEVLPTCPINIPLKMMNRHGLIAGATGTGKSKTLQLIAENLSDAGVPVLLMDIKGDLSGLAAAGSAKDFILKRYQLLAEDYKPQPYPVELLTLTNDYGAQLRSTVVEFGPTLLGKVLDLNDTQQSILAILFKYCDDNNIPILDLKDLTQLLQYANDEGQSKIEAEYGRISSASISTILRKVIALQQQGADDIFGEHSFETNDLIRHNDKGQGFINVLRVTNMQDKPAIFSTFMLQMLAELYQTLPEEGDLEQPKLVLFIDEAHLIFKEASKDLLNQIESTIKLIRSKGVGIFFCTQNPDDVPEGILGQLGMKIQHALRAFTAKDRKNIKQTAQNYPLTDYYNTEELLTSLGIGEAIVTTLNEKGIPTPLAHTFLMTPRSRMDILEKHELESLLSKSYLNDKYKESIDRESAYEILSKKVNEDAKEVVAKTTKRKPGRPKEEKSIFEQMINSAAGKQAQRSIVRGLFGMLTKMLK